MACKIVYKNNQPIGVEDNNELFQEIWSNPAVKSFDEALEIFMQNYPAETGISIQEAVKRNNGNPLNLAPNGKPSVLYQSYKDLGYSDTEAERLTAQVFSDEFKAWFDSSKIVDRNGQPLVVYHGTNADFNEFSTEYGKYTDGTFFSTKLGTASIYGNIRPFFIKVSNLKEVGSSLPGVYDLSDIRETDFDGLWNKGTNEIVVGVANQIKSATENIGTFSAKTPDIRYSLANQSEENIIRRSDLTPIADQTVADIVEYNQFYKSKELLEKGTKRTKPKQFVENSKFNNTENPILTLANPSEILLSVGIPNLPISVPFKYFQEHLIENRDHEIAASEISEIMRGIHNPLAIYKNTERQEYTRTNRYEILTPLKNKNGDNILVVLEVERIVPGKKDVFGKQTVKINTINTAFSETNSGARLKYAFDNNKVLFVNKKRIEESYLGGSIKSSVVNRNDSINSAANIEQIIDKIKSFNNNLGFTQVMFRQQRENTIKYKTPQGQGYSTYAEALKNTSEGVIEVGTNTVDGFKTMFTVDSSLNVDTQEGLINNLVKSNFLTGVKLDGNVLETKGNSDAKKAVTAEMTVDFIQNKFGKRAARVTEDFNVEIDQNRIQGQVQITKANGETEFIKIEDLNNKSFSQLKQEYGDEFAAEVVAQGEFKREFNSNSRQKSTLTDTEFIPENELQEKLVRLLKDMGIKTLSFVDYATKYATKNGISPDARALADLANQVIAFKDGIITEEDLLEETSHFIISATPKETLDNLLRNVHKTKEWMEFSEQYMEIYKDEALVREEILGKVLANSLQSQFQQRGENQTEDSIIARLKEIFENFFNRISEFFNPTFEGRLESYTQEVYKNLMREELSDKLNKGEVGSRSNIFYSVNNASSKSIDLYVKSKQLLDRLLSQQYQLNKKYSSISDKKLLQEAREMLSLKESEVQQAEKLRALSNILAVASSQTQVLAKAVEGKDNTGYHFTQEESVVYQNLLNRAIPLLEEIQGTLGDSSTEKSMKSEIDNIVAKFSKVRKIIPANQNIAFNRIVDRVITKSDLDIVRQPDGTYTGTDSFFGEQIYKALTTVQKDTDFFHAHLGSLLAASNPILNLAGDIIEKTKLEENDLFQIASKKLVNGLDKIGFNFLKLNDLIEDGYILNEKDQKLVKQADLEDKTEAYNKAVDILGLSKAKATTSTIESEVKKLNSEDTEEARELRQLYKKNWNKILKDRRVTYFSKEWIDKLNNVEISLIEPNNVITKDSIAESVEVDAQFRRERSQILQNAGDNLTNQDKARLQELNKRRLQAKNPRDSNGELKPGLKEVYDRINNQYVVVIDEFPFKSLSQSQQEEARIIFGLNIIDLMNRKFYSDPLNKRADGIPQKFIDALNLAEDKVEFLINNSYIGYPQEFWDNFKANESIVAKLRNIGTQEANDIIESIRRQQSIISKILKENATYNRPSETNFSEMKSISKVEVKEAASLLESFYSEAKRLLPKSDAEQIELEVDNTVNDAYVKAIEDNEIKTFEQELEFILENVTARNRDSIIAAKEVLQGRRSIPKHLSGYLREGMDSNQAQQAVLRYAKTKLLPYFKRTEPIGFTQAWQDLNNGAISAEDFISRTDIVKVTPNFSFYENTDNINPEWTKNNEQGKEQYTKEYLKRVRNDKFYNRYGIDSNGNATKNTTEWEARKLLLEYQKEAIEYNGLTGVQDIYMQPQVRRTNVEKVTSTTIKGMKEILKDIYTYRPEELELGETVDGSAVKAGSQLLSIPTYYNRPLDDPKELTNNVLYAYLMYGKAAAAHKARRENIGDILVLSDTLKSTEFSEKEADRTNAFKMLQSQIDSNFYGVQETFSLNTNILGRNVDLGKTAKTVNNFFKRTALSGAVVPVTSYLTAKTQQTVELMIGEISNRTAVTEGRALFRRHRFDSIKEIGSLNSTGFLNVVGENLGIYNAIKRYEDSKYNKATRIALDYNDIPHMAGNFAPVATMMATVISDLRIVDGRIIDFNQFKRKFAASGNKGNVTEEWKKNELFSTYMEMAVKDGVLDFSNPDFIKAIEPKLKLEQGQELKDYLEYKKEYMSQRILAGIQRIDAQIPMHQKSIWARDARANFFLSFLNFLMVQIPLKFKKRQLNISEGTIQVGNYRETWDFLNENLKNPKGIYEAYKKADDVTKMALRRTLIDLAVVNALAIAALVLSHFADDDDTPYPVALADYFLSRVAIETAGGSLALPATVTNIIENPLLIYSKGKDWAKVGDLLGDEPSKYLLRTMPYAKDFKKIYDPRTARESYMHFQEAEAGQIFDRYAWFSNILPDVIEGEE